jgi:hypothetical protein
MDFRPNPLWQKAGLEYVGESSQVKLVKVIEKYSNRELKVPGTPSDFLEFVSAGNIGGMGNLATDCL